MDDGQKGACREDHVVEDRISKEDGWARQALHGCLQYRHIALRGVFALFPFLLCISSACDRHNTGDLKSLGILCHIQQIAAGVEETDRQTAGRWSAVYLDSITGGK